MQVERQPKPWNDYAAYLRKRFGSRVQKISVDAGFTCPNRNGTLSETGCIYCNNETFSPFYCNPKKTITHQLNEGIAFFSKKYRTQNYLAYFQSYTNTYAEIEHCISLYQEALSVDNVIGLVIATRPDCVSNELLKEISLIAKDKYTVIEFGVESTNNQTLRRINRFHTYEQSVEAIARSNENGIYTGIHLILGLPDEDRDTMILHAKNISDLPVHNLKIHQLQIIKGTVAESMFREKPEQFTLFGIDEYVALVSEFLCYVRPGIMPDRFSSESPQEMLIAPCWGGLKNYELIHRVEKFMISKGWTQGMHTH
ncbi:MAG: TIGR01212 family radical SAM protein [Bacteroidales bacterium]|nr:TIGR01212 family radical SAM protein [Bacteroidales bacterium]HOY38442.1 TIGR01212 family radical SAM protein [Bacteroidales bacterium]HQP03133.1 TIGR01212 family radical SAM protein [Bacteroidales bacterium]